VTALEQLKQTMRIDQHVASRALAERLYGRVEAMLGAGMERDPVYAALNSLYLQYREHGQAVERDAVAEVLDAFDGLCASDSAL
jgi:hypothetical protein